MRRARGVTLIELLLAVSLLSLLSVGILMAMRVGLNAMEKANSRLLDNRRVASVQRILRSQIAGFLPASADCYTGPQMQPRKFVLFEGRPQAMRIVSTYSLEEAARGRPRLLEFVVIPAENSRGVRLVVNEFLYTGPRMAGASCMGFGPGAVQGIEVPRFRPVEPGPHSFVLADRLAYCRFLYRKAEEPMEPERWLPDWDLPGWPSAVRVEMAPLEPDAARVPLAGVTVPLRINRNPLMIYADY